MKKIFMFILCSFMVLTSSLLIGCYKEKTYTDNEVIAETKSYLNAMFESGYVYTDIDLPTSYELNPDYISYINWESSNSEIINALNGKVYRNEEKDQSCKLTASITYKSLTDKMILQIIVPANKYENNNPTFSNSNQIGISVSYLKYNSDKSLTLKLTIYNNLSSKATLYGLNNMTFSIYYYNNGYQYLIKNLTYNNTTKKQFTCTYHNTVAITFKIESKNIYIHQELAQSKYIISYKDVQITYAS